MKNIDLYPAIFTRKSVRKFKNTPVESETLEQIEKFITTLKPLLPGADIQHKIVRLKDAKGLMMPKAPHVILVSAKEQPLRNVCAGFLFQYVELYLHTLGLGACWVGSAKGKQADPNNILGIVFGKPAENAARTLADFKRKPIAEIAQGTDSRLEAARLAPSGINMQPWYFIAENNTIHVYCKKSLGGLLGKFYNLTDLDVGIALCHLAIASEHEGKPFNFNANKENIPTPPKGFSYIGTIS